MARFRWPLLATAGILAALSGCSGFDHRERPAWRDQAEEACLAQNLVQESAWIQPMHAIDGPGICGMHHPFKVRGLADGTVTVTSAAVLDCSMIPALDAWIKTVLQPAALARFGEPIVELRTMGTYNCRGINNESGGTLSEHSFGNAMDVASFVLRSGRVLNIMRGWNSADPQERAFLHEAHGGACGMFTTVLGPGSNVFHYNHYHLDLAMHGNTSRGPRRVCKPAPEQALPAPPQHDTLPEPPPIDEEQDMAAAPRPPAETSETPSLALAAPAVPNASLPLGNTREKEARGQLPDTMDAAATPPDATGAPAEWDLTSSIRRKP